MKSVAPSKSKSADRDARKTVSDSDFTALFSGKSTPEEQDFAAVLDKHLTPENLDAAINEKNKADKTKEPSVQEMIKHYPPPQDELDLHGRTADEAEKQCTLLVKRALRKKLKTVRIITGKGRHSPNGAVLPDVVEAKLREMKSRQLLSAFRWEKKEKQKSGAVLVYL